MYIKEYSRHTNIIVQIFTKINSKYLYYDILKTGEDMNDNILIKRMRSLREDHDLTQQYIAKKLHTSQTMYARYERGANELPIRHLITLCKFYNVSSDYLLGLSNRK